MMGESDVLTNYAPSRVDRYRWLKPQIPQGWEISISLTFLLILRSIGSKFCYIGTSPERAPNVCVVDIEVDT